MKKRNLLIYALLIFIFSFSLVFAENSSGGVNGSKLGYYYGSFTNILKIPEYSSDPSCPVHSANEVEYEAEFQLRYDPNTREILGGDIINYHLNTQTSYWDLNTARVSGISPYGDLILEIDGDDVTFRYAMYISVAYYSYEQEFCKTVSKVFLQEKVLENIDRP